MRELELKTDVQVPARKALLTAHILALRRRAWQRDNTVSRRRKSGIGEVDRRVGSKTKKSGNNVEE